MLASDTEEHWTTSSARSNTTPASGISMLSLVTYARSTTTRGCCRISRVAAGVRQIPGARLQTNDESCCRNCQVSVKQQMLEEFSQEETPPKHEVKHLRVFGCVGFVHIQKQQRVQRQKFEPRATKQYFIGFPRVRTSNYTMWDPVKNVNLSVTTNAMVMMPYSIVITPKAIISENHRSNTSHS